MRLWRIVTAPRLHTVRSPDCNAERDKLSLLSQPESHDSSDTAAQQRKRVMKTCSVVATPMNTCLVQVWACQR
jgi:hypothetical protein